MLGKPWAIPDAMMKAELTNFLGRDRYVRGTGEPNHRNGSYDRNFTLKGVGEVQVNVPRDRNGDFQTQVIPRSKQYEEEISRDLSLLFLSGVSTRSLSMISLRLLGGDFPHRNQQCQCRALTEAVEKWRMSDLSGGTHQISLCGRCELPYACGKKIEFIPVLVAIGVTDGGHKLVVGLQAGDKESASCWREFFKDLKVRGLDGQKLSWESWMVYRDWNLSFEKSLPCQDPTLPGPCCPECSGQGAEESSNRLWRMM